MRVYAISADAVRDLRALKEERRLGFPLLSDEGLGVIRRYGVVHAGKNISLPAVFVVTPDRKIAYRHIARRVWDRPTWKELEAALQRLSTAQPPPPARGP